MKRFQWKHDMILLQHLFVETCMSGRCVFHCGYSGVTNVTLHRSLILTFIHCAYKYGACGSVVGRGIMLQAGRSWVRFPMRALDSFSMYLILPTTLWPWDRLSL
jgi:hypothetical protein